jgi:histone H3/H4
LLAKSRLTSPLNKLAKFDVQPEHSETSSVQSESPFISQEVMQIKRDVDGPGKAVGRRTFTSSATVLEVLFLFSILLTSLARSLREIKYYQSTATAEAFLIPQSRFKKVACEVLQDFNHQLRFERDALVALQTMTEHVLIMLFEMTQQLAIHAKRQTVMCRDMELIRDIIHTIDPSNVLGDKCQARKDNWKRLQKDADVKCDKAIIRAKEEIKKSREKGQRVPNRLVRFLDNNGDAPRKSQRTKDRNHADVGNQF